MRPRVAALRQQIVLNAVTSSSGRAASSESVRTLAGAAQATHASEISCVVHQEDDAASRSNRPADDALDASAGASRIASAPLGKQSCRCDSQRPARVAVEFAVRRGLRQQRHRRDRNA